MYHTKEGKERGHTYIYGQSTRCIQKRRRREKKMSFIFVDSTEGEMEVIIVVDVEQKKRLLLNKM